MAVVVVIVVSVVVAVILGVICCRVSSGGVCVGFGSDLFMLLLYKWLCLGLWLCLWLLLLLTSNTVTI